MGAFSAMVLMIAGFALGFAAMWGYCHYIRDRKRPTR